MTDKVAVDLRVGMMDVSLCQLLTKDHRIIEFPSILLPDDVKAGSIITISCERDSKAEREDARAFEQTQRNILELYTREPKPLTLSVTSVTQTSVVLQWDKLYLGSADLRSLALYKNNEQLGLIPNALKRTSTKLSNLEIDKEYAFQLVLSTSAGVFKSNEVKAQTLKMTDLSGITACVGSLEGSAISMAELQATVDRIRCHELQDEVHLDTTHFICTEPEGKQYQKAQQLNIPIVRPEWLKACEEKRRLVNVHQYYLSADPRLMPPGRHRTASIATAVTNDADTSQRTISGGTSTTSVAEVPKVSVSAVDGGQRSAEDKSKSPAIDEEKAQTGEVAGPSDSKSPTETESEKAAEATTGNESKLPTGETSETTLKPNPESLETSKSPLSEGSEPSELEVDSNANKLQDEINPKLIDALQKDVKEVTAKAEQDHRDSEHQLEEEAAQAERELEASLAKHPERFEPAERADILEADEPDAENSTIVEEVRAAEIASSPEFEEQDLGAQDSDVETPQKAAQSEAEVEANITEAEKLTDSKDDEETSKKPESHEHTQLEDPAKTAQLEIESHAEGSEKESSESHENAQLEDPVKSAQIEREDNPQAAEQDSEDQPEKAQFEDPAKSAELESQKSEDAQPETQLEDPVESAELESQAKAQPDAQLEDPVKSAEIKHESQKSEDAETQLEDPVKSAEIERDSQANEPENADAQTQQTPETEGSEPPSEEKPEFITEDSDQEPVAQTPKKKKNKKKGKKK